MLIKAGPSFIKKKILNFLQKKSSAWFSATIGYGNLIFNFLLLSLLFNIIFIIIILLLLLIVVDGSGNCGDGGD